MEVRINKEVRNYQESVFFGLSLRQAVCALLAVTAAVIAYFTLKGVVGVDAVGWICILGAAPFALCGFFTYNGMTAEQFLFALLRFYLCPFRLTDQPQNLYAQALDRSAVKEVLKLD